MLVQGLGISTKLTLTRGMVYGGGGLRRYITTIPQCSKRPIGRLVLTPYTPLLRYNSSSSPTSSKPAQPTLTTSPSTSQTAHERSSKSLYSRFTSAISLANEKGPATEESSSSSVKKLVLLAKPESRQLSIAVGLVSFKLLPWRYTDESSSYLVQYQCLSPLLSES